MPANWATFIPALANTLQSQQFTKPGGAGISYALPVQESKVGNPLNSALKSNQADYINAYNPQPLSGRYDFGKQVAQHYLDAVKNMAMTHVAALHINNPAAETLLKEGYGIAFERLLREGDIPLMDQYDEDGNLTEMGKESHPAYADFCETYEEPTAEDLAALEEENKKAFNKFTAPENVAEYELYKFKFYQFPCLSGEESQEELEVIFATRILMGYKFMSSASSRWDYFVWACHLGKFNYSTNAGLGNNDLPYPNINSKARSQIASAGYDYEKLADNVSKYVRVAILAAHPKRDNDSGTGTNSAIKKRIQRTAVNEIEFPTLLDPDGKDVTPTYCPINPYKIQVAYDFEHNPPENPSKRPKILTSNVIACFTYYPNKRTGGQPYIVDNVKVQFSKGTNNVKYEKTVSWVKSKYENGEWKNHWRKVPANKLKAAAYKADAQKAFFEIDPLPEGTLFKFEYHRALCAVKKAASCDEPMAEVPHPWDPSGETPGGKTYSGDPYMMMARVTIAYWYACVVKPFQPVTSAPPALIPPPLTGIYIPIYYGSANRLANNLRKAWNTGKSFATPGTQQPASTSTATAVAGTYALHLLEFKLLYLGGIPTPVGPVPMVGFVPITF